MGIKHLWSILGPFSERKPLYELQGKTVAIDLSCWICEAQNLPTHSNIQPKMYLRNLYFRTCFLLLMEVNPIFVLDGKPPELKYQTIAARNATQFKKSHADNKKPKNQQRSHFNFVLQRCEEMLRLMGLVCIKSKGEAEALCAYLNKHKLVDGCISQDSDCFAYGARVVYRNFSISFGGGSVDVYNIEKINNLGRNKMIALALLCGSDYNSDGVHGIGKEAALKLFDHVSDDEILERLRSWRSNEKYYIDLSEQVNDRSLCTSCGHLGRLASHTKSGCPKCQTKNGCDSTHFKEKRLEHKNEIVMRLKALTDPNFPDENLVQEFLSYKENIQKIDSSWKRPNLVKFVEFATHHLQWEQVYALQKILPIFTRWQLAHNDAKDGSEIVPERIKKIRRLKGIASYEIVWRYDHYPCKDLIPQDQLTDMNFEDVWTTVEPQDLVNKAYPTLTQAFEETRKPKRTKKKVDAIEKMLANTSITDSPKPKRPCKKQTKQPTNTIDLYFMKDKTSHEQDLSRFGDEDDLDVLDIVDEIVNRERPKYVEDNLHALGYCSTPKREKMVVESSFFISNVNEDDLFERSMNIVGESSSDEEYIPLLTRLKHKLV